MATVIKIAGTEINYQDFEIDIPISSGGIAPTAIVRTTTEEAISAADSLTITIDGTTRFSGETTSGGTADRIGSVRVEAEHNAVELFGEDVSFTETGPPTVDDVLRGALSASDSGGSFSLSSTGTNVTLNNAYEAEDRSVKRVFRDMTDRAGLVWWVDPVDDTINVEPAGNRGQWKDLNVETDKTPLTKWDPGSRDTVLNDVTVVGTSDVKVTGTASDSTSISNYGRQEDTFNVDYITTQAEADAMASELLVADPLAEGIVFVGDNVGAVEAPQVNKTLGIQDDGKGVDETGLVIEQQTIKQGQAELKVGKGNTVSIANLNRKTKSENDNSRPGTVVDSTRIADDSIDTQQLIDRAVSSAKVEISGIIAENISDSAVERAKIAQAAINEDKIETGTIGATRLFIEDWIPIGLEFRNGEDGENDFDGNALSSDEIAWNDHSLVYDGTEYSINKGVASYRHIYWNNGDNTYSSSEVDPDLGDGDAMVAINDVLDDPGNRGRANQILQATEIHGGSLKTGSIRAGEIETGALTADVIAAGTITADEIDALDLDTNQLSVTDGGNGLEFITETFGNITSVTMRPTDSGASALGESGKTFGNAYINIVDAIDVQPLNGDNSGEVGSATDAWGEMHSHSYVTESPEAIAGVDTATIRETDWYDNPPAAVRERARQVGETDAEIPEGRDHTPVELGTMANWLLEAVKAQQDVIDDQADRIDDLEARLSAVEEQL